MNMFIKTQDEIITEMCYTMRHDYGLEKHPDDAKFVAGMLPRERDALRLQMKQLLENVIIPNLHQH